MSGPRPAGGWGGSSHKAKSNGQLWEQVAGRAPQDLMSMEQELVWGDSQTCAPITNPPKAPCCPQLRGEGELLSPAPLVQ